MVYIHSWQEYQKAAETLYSKSPNKARYCVKWKPSEGKLVLKITDDTTCLKYKTHSSIFLNRFEALNLSLMEKMCNRRPPPPQQLLVAPSPMAAAGVSGAAMQVDEGSRAATPLSGATAGSGAAKKKKGKKKK